MSHQDAIALILISLPRHPCRSIGSDSERRIVMFDRCVRLVGGRDALSGRHTLHGDVPVLKVEHAPTSQFCERKCVTTAPRFDFSVGGGGSVDNR